MRRRWWWLAALLVLGGCEEEVEEVEAPEAVAPVEVTSEDTPAADPATPTAEGTPDVAALQARVTELEGQLAACRGEDATAANAGTTPQGGTQVAAVPEGVDVPGDDSAPSTASTRSSSGSGSSGSSSSSSSRRGGSGNDGTPGGLLGALLGDDTGSGNGSGNGSSGRRGRSNDQGSGNGNALPNPVDVLLGPGE